MQGLGKLERLEGGTTAESVRNEDMLIISVDLSITNSADRVTEMFQNTPAFSGISGAIDLLQAPAGNNEIPIASTVSAASFGGFEGTPILESTKFEIPTTDKPSKESSKKKANS